MRFDVAMPLALFATITTALLVHGKAEGRLKATFKEELGVWNALALVTMICLAVSLITFAPRLAITLAVLLACSTLLFAFTYTFSDVGKLEASLFCLVFLLISLIAATVNLFDLHISEAPWVGASAFYAFSIAVLAALLYENVRVRVGRRWCLAALPPTLFVLLYVFFNRTYVWFPHLMNLHGAAFAVLITVYVGNMFTWKASLIFIGLLTLADVVLVTVTEAMVSAAMYVYDLRLPMLITLPTVPLSVTQQGVFHMNLGVGDLFFAGFIAVQTARRFNRSFAFLSAIAMSTSFFVFEALMLSYGLRAFPGTLMIVCGWLPLMLLKSLKKVIVG